ncbi:MAG: hypothetical protein AB1625_10915 [Acidobacteriota bacterium]
MRSLPAVLLLATVAGFVTAPDASGDGLTITPDHSPVSAGVTVVFRINPKVASEQDFVDVLFGDGGSGRIAFQSSCTLFGGCDTIEHIYAGPGVFTVTASGLLGGTEVSGATQVTVTASEDEHDIYVVSGAHSPGYNDSVWRTDVDVHNQGTRIARYYLKILRHAEANADGEQVLFSLSPGQSAHYGDVLLDVFGFTGKAAIRIIPVEGNVMATSRTFNQAAAGTFGQFVPGQPRYRAIAYGQVGRMIGLFHDPGLAVSFRTNIGLVNASPGPISVELKFIAANGIRIGTTLVELLPYEFRQFDRAFEEVTGGVVSGAYVTARTTTSGGKFYAYASMVDNVTNDAVFIPATTGE